MKSKICKISDALRREKYLKTTEGKYFLEKQLKSLLSNLQQLNGPFV